MIKVANCACSLDDALVIPYGCASDDATLRRIAAQALGTSARDVLRAEVLRRSVDARKKGNVHIVLTLAVALRNSRAEHRLVEQGRATAYVPYEPLDIDAVAGSPQVPHRPLVVGLGPAGLFAGLYLARAGLRPLVIERGADVHTRQQAVGAFNEGGALDLRTNIQFGEGGAGTFSDGKLTTGTKHPFASHVLHWFVDAGAPRDILWDAKPHIGSDVLPGVVETLRNQIIVAGGEVRFETRLADVSFEGGHLVAAVVESARGKQERIPVRALLLACGHSARDTFEMLQSHGLVMESKPFSMGVRIEHLQASIDGAQYGAAAGHRALGAADYSMAVHVNEKRSAYTFCMCPGGDVVCAASEEGGICTNGMSNRARNGGNANAAVLVNVDPADLGSDNPLAGMYLQREVEQRAFSEAAAAGGRPYQAPCQTVGHFLATHMSGGSASGGVPADSVTAGKVAPTYARGTVACDLHRVLPSFVCDTIAEAFPLFDRKLRGFASPEALMTAPETRSSSPVRICRTDGFQAMLSGASHDQGCGIYLCGEGPGYAGGIMSAAADGMRVAERLACDLRGALAAEGASDEEAFAAAVDVLCRGHAAVFPTDTVAGLGVSVLHARTPDEIFRVKRRDEGNPVAWLVAGVEALRSFGVDLPEGVENLARACWPGPLTIIVKASASVPPAFRSQTGTVGLRMPDNRTALRLMRELNSPLATSSANISGEPAPATPQEVALEIREAVDAVLVDGSSPSGKASTVLDCSQGGTRILREGAIDEGTIRAYLGIKS